ncbi:EpsG family protein [Macrococcoides canis]|uniref:EpsG family protein n=1 Tax=Macrococcoides canis TaxID=1855823 RepID=UPI00106045C1|nr:EpsG family protein [Macrococcus canis]TDM36665.1 EpsG family protein [Macrococcus canis]
MYYLIFLVGLLFSISKLFKKALTIVFTLILILFAGFRYGVGTDYFGYYYLYNNYSLSFKNHITNIYNYREELGFRLIAVIFKNIGLEFQFFVAFFSVISILTVYFIARKYSVNTMTSLLVFYSIFYIVWIQSGIRQGFTIFLGLLIVLYCFKSNKNILIIPLVCILFLFHKASVIILPLYYISKQRWNLKTLSVISIISVLLSMLPISPIYMILQYTTIGQRGTAYNFSDSIINLDFQSIVRIIFLFIVLISYRNILILDKKNYFILNYYIFGLVFYFLFKDIELIAARLSIYSRASEILIIPMLLKLLINKQNSILYALLIVVYLCSYYLKDLNTMSNNVFTDNKYNLVK